MFYGLLEEVLNESSVSPDRIDKVMDDHEKVIITYRPVTKGREHATGPRLVGVFAYGQTKASNDCIRVYEYAGDTATFVPGWKLLRLDQILSWKSTGQTFDTPPDKKFDPDTDKSMSVVFKVTQFNTAGSLTNDSAKGPKTSDDLFLTDTEKELKKRGERLRNQFNNPLYISDLKAKKGMEDYRGGQTEFTDGPKTSDSVNKGNRLSYKDEVADRFKDLRNKIANAKKIEIPKKKKATEKAPEVSKPEITKEPSYKDEVAKMFEPLKNRIANAKKIDLPRTGKKANTEKDEDELEKLREVIGDTNQPIRIDELKRRLGMLF